MYYYRLWWHRKAKNHYEANDLYSVCALCVFGWTTKGICDVKYGDLKTKITDRRCQTILLRAFSTDHDVMLYSHSQYPPHPNKKPERKRIFVNPDTMYKILMGFSVSAPCLYMQTALSNIYYLHAKSISKLLHVFLLSRYYSRGFCRLT